MNQLLWGYKTKEMHDDEDTILAAITRAPTPTDPVRQERIRQWKIKREKIRPYWEARGYHLNED